MSCVSGELSFQSFTKTIFLSPRVVSETIGSIAYIHERFEALRNIEFGSLYCVGDEGPVSYLPSLSGNMLMDRIVQNLKKNKYDEIRLHTWISVAVMSGNLIGLP